MSPPAVLRQLLGDERICIADVGAADGLALRWQPIAPVLRVVAFEPDARSPSTAAWLDADVAVVGAAAAAAEGDAVLSLARKPRCSSLYAPNREVVDRYGNPERYDIVGSATVRCVTVDAALQRQQWRPDFLKIDTQGTELDVLRGAESSLTSCLGLEIEVEFQPLYEGAVVFRDVDRHVSERGFEIFDLRRTFFTRGGGSGEVAQRKGQLVFGDVLYFRRWDRLGERSAVVKLAILMLTYGFADVVTEIVTRSPLLAESDRQALAQLCRELHPVPGVTATRKDRFLGAGLQLS